MVGGIDLSLSVLDRGDFGSGRADRDPTGFFAGIELVAERDALWLYSRQWGRFLVILGEC